MEERFYSRTFDPRTPTEQMLLNQIKKLESKLYYARMLPDWHEYYDSDGPTSIIQKGELPPKLILYPSARLLTNIDDCGRLVVRVDAWYGSTGKQFGSQYMTDCCAKTKFEAADMAMEIYKAQVHLLARALETGEID